MKDWLASIKKGRCIYELSHKEIAYVAFNTAVGTVWDFIGCRLVGNLQLSWSEFEGLYIKEFANEGTAIGSMRSLIKLMQLKNKTPGGLGQRSWTL